MSQLIYVSNNAIQANDSQNPFFLQEKCWFLDRFGNFMLVCPKGVYRCANDGTLVLLSRMSWIRRLMCFCKAPWDINMITELRKMVRDHRFSIKNLLRLIHFVGGSIILGEYIKAAIKGTKFDDILLYSYWLSYDAYACAKVKREHPELFAIARAHSYEIQLHRNACNPYLMKEYICSHMDQIAFISEDSMQSLFEYYVPDKENLAVVYLGSTMNNTGYVKRENRDKLTILSCSSIIPIKQLEWMIEALAKWKGGCVHWIHIGDGSERESIIKLAEDELADNRSVTYEFVGRMTNGQVHEYLQRSEIDVFVNMSKTEGVPVSIMEAMSAGVPVVAPRMFGIPELIDDNCGILFDPKGGVQALAEALVQFDELSVEQRQRMGKCAYMKWRNAFCLENNLAKLFAVAPKE